MYNSLGDEKKQQQKLLDMIRMYEIKKNVLLSESCHVKKKVIQIIC